MEIPSDNPGYLLRQDEDSLYHMVTPKVRDRMQSAYTVLESYDEDGICNRVKINDVEHDLRISFWREYDYCKAHGVPMKMTRVFHGVCTQRYWDTVINNDYKLAYILIPPKDYANAIESMLVRGLSRLNEIIKLPFAEYEFDDQGNQRVKKINIHAAKLVKETVDMLDKRRYGMYTQRNVNINTEVKQENSQKQLGNIDEELKRVEAELAGNPILVEHTTVTETTEVVSDERD